MQVRQRERFFLLIPEPKSQCISVLWYFREFHRQKGNVGVLVPGCCVTMCRKKSQRCAWKCHSDHRSSQPLASTKANECMSKAILIQGWPCGVDISSSYKFKHYLWPRLSSCNPLFYFLLVLCVWRTTSHVLSRGEVFLSLMQVKFSCWISIPRQRDKLHEKEPGWFLSH